MNFFLSFDGHLATTGERDRFRMDLVLVRAHLAHELLHTFLINEHFLALRLAALVGEGDLDAGIQESEFTQAHEQTIKDVSRRDGEDAGVREEGNLRAGGLRIIEVAKDGQRLRRFTALEADGVDFAIAEDLALEPVGQRIRTLRADAVEAAGKLIRAITELAARVQAGQHEFDRWNSGLGVHFHRDAAAVVLNGDGTVGVNCDPDVFAMTGEMLVDGVVHHFKHAVVQAAFIGITDIHAGAEADRFEAFEFLNLIGTVGLIFGHTGIESSVLLRRLFGHKS